MEPDGGGAPRSSDASAARAWALALVVVVVVLAGAGLWVFESLRRLPAEAAAGGRRLVGELAEVAAAFKQGRIETSFTSYATSVTGTSYLQFASLQQTEVYTRQDSASVLWGALALPDVVVSATAPVEYSYYLDLDEPWQFELTGNQLLVRAPPIRFNTPSIDASEIRYEVRESSLLRDEAAALVLLKRGLTAMARQRAESNIPLVRELGRRKVAEFVGRWLTGSFGDGDRYAISVRFAGEPPALDVAAEGELPGAGR